MNQLRINQRGGTSNVNQTEEILDDLALMGLQAAALFTYDKQGRLVTTNEPAPVRAPRLFLGLTSKGFVWNYRDDVPKKIVRDLTRILDEAASLTDPQELPPILDALRDALAVQAPVTEIWHGPAWRFPETIAAPKSVAAIGSDEVEMLRKHFPFMAEHLREEEPCFAVIEDGEAVSICRGVRIRPLVAEAGVETVEAFRGRGYAVRVVSAWARAVREVGRVPLYSTSWDNAASRSVARKLGLVHYGVDLSLT
jgi:RimJ/RimL family protein N-acetyltransferase